MATFQKLTKPVTSTASTDSSKYPQYGPASVFGDQYPNVFELADLIPEGIAPALPGLEDLASKVNSFQQGQLSTELESFFPGLKSATATASQKVQDMLSGIVPDDVSAAITDNAAAKSLGAGVGTGGQFQGNLMARDLGRMSLDLINQGISSLGSLTGNIRQNMTVDPWDITQNIPNIGDLWNASSTVASQNIAERQSQRDIALANQALAQAKNAGTTSTKKKSTMADGRYRVVDSGAGNLYFTPLFGW